MFEIQSISETMANVFVHLLVVSEVQLISEPLILENVFIPHRNSRRVSRLETKLLVGQVKVVWCSADSNAP